MTTDNLINLIAAILVGGGTFFLGIMAWRTIRQTRSVQKAEKRERLLNEIIEWARSILTWRSRHKDIFRDVARSTSDIESIRLVHANIAQVLGDFAGITGLNEYMKEVALRLEQGLPETVEKLISDTGTYIDFLEQRFYELTPNIKRGIFSETDEVINTTEILAEQMVSSARCVLASVAKIKTKDIG